MGAAAQADHPELVTDAGGLGVVGRARLRMAEVDAIELGTLARAPIPRCCCRLVVAADVNGGIPRSVLADGERRAHLDEDVAVVVHPLALERDDPAAAELWLVDRKSVV